MKFLNYLSEEYIGVFNSWGTGVTIFCNPDNKEMIELKNSTPGYNDVRFIIDFDSKKIFMWKGTIHRDAYDYLVTKKEIKSKEEYNSLNAANYYFLGLAGISGKKLKYEYSDALTKRTEKEIKRFKWLNSDLSWLSVYFTNINFLTLEHLLADYK